MGEESDEGKFITIFLDSYNLDEVKVRNVSFLLYLNLGEI